MVIFWGGWRQLSKQTFLWFRWGSNSTGNRKREVTERFTCGMMWLARGEKGVEVYKYSQPGLPTERIRILCQIEKIVAEDHAFNGKSLLLWQKSAALLSNVCSLCFPPYQNLHLLMPIMTSARDTTKLSSKLSWATRKCCVRHPHSLHREGRLVWRLPCHPSPCVYNPLSRGMWKSGLYSCLEGRKHVVGSLMTMTTVSASNCACVKN